MMTQPCPKTQGKSFPSTITLHADTVDVKKLLLTIIVSKASGPENNPCRVLKEENDTKTRVFYLSKTSKLQTSTDDTFFILHINVN